jgi:hypothetical protein
MHRCSTIPGWRSDGRQRGGKFCLGYVNGYLTGHNDAIFQNQNQNPRSNAKLVFCTTKRDVSGGQLARVLVKFLRDHPQSLDMSPDVLTMLAFKEAFPCSGNE